MMYEMFGEQILNNVLFALKRADNLPTDKNALQAAADSFSYSLQLLS